ncbi:MAG TPA: response regulator [Candidatus Acidoferrales bacterium]|nr:response regulator [Candidatus Acidoferrales bacterium]
MATILVADDNSNIQKMVSLVFEEKGVRVVAVGNGEAACRKVPEVHPDLVLADVFMPVRNGYEVCEFVKHDPQFAGIPVVLLVGAFDPLDEKEAQRVGANGVLKKPFVPPEPLIAMVSSFLGNLEPPAVEAPPTPTRMESPVMESPEIAPAPPPVRVSRVPVEEESEPEPEEFTVAMNPRDFEEAGGAEQGFGSPVATPPAKHEDELAAEDEEPENEWQRRRAAVEYEIPEADSDDLVKRLSAEARDDDSDSADAVAAPKTHVHVPFGGAVIPEGEPEPKARPSQSSAPEWTDQTPPAAAAPVETASVPPLAKSPVIEESAAAEIVEENSPEPAAVEAEAKTATHRDTWENSVSQHEETKAQSPMDAAEEEDIQEMSPASPAEGIPFRAPSGPIQSSEFVPPDANEPVYEREISDPIVSKEAENFAESSPAEEDSAAAKQDSAPTEIHRYVGIIEESSELSAASDGTSKAPANPANIDDVVAKVLEKLEPQIHELLSKGVLRPLVEDVLNRESEKK